MTKPIILKKADKGTTSLMRSRENTINKGLALLNERNNCHYYINTNEIPGERLRENLISSHLKITCYLHM